MLPNLPFVAQAGWVQLGIQAVDNAVGVAALTIDNPYGAYIATQTERLTSTLREYLVDNLNIDDAIAYTTGLDKADFSSKVRLDLLLLDALASVAVQVPVEDAVARALEGALLTRLPSGASPEGIRAVLSPWLLEAVRNAAPVAQTGYNIGVTTGQTLSAARDLYTADLGGLLFGAGTTEPTT